MKNIYFLLAASLMIASCGPTTVVHDSYEPAPAPVAPEVSYQSFYDQLSPYGNWINYPGYGYVWMPNTGPDFQPYATNGNWIYTNAGWTWASNYSWGWAPFHYGRWFYENGYGWMWVPGNEWAPAWVSWRGGGDYYGWAPLGPHVSVDIALSNYNPPAYYWNFVPRRYMGNPNWHNYYVSGGRNVTIINNTTIINNYSGTNRTRYAYAPGPDPNEVRRESGNNFRPVQIREMNTPGERMSGSQYDIYQPRVNNVATRADAAGRPSTPAPNRYESFRNVRPSAQYPVYNQPNNNPAQVNNPQPPANTRPAMQNPASNQPVNNPPANTPGTTYPAAGNNQPVNHNRPSNPNPGYDQPVSQPRLQEPAVRPRTEPQNPVNNPQGNNPGPSNGNNGNNQPANNPRPSNGNNGNSQPVDARPENPIHGVNPRENKPQNVQPADVKPENPVHGVNPRENKPQNSATPGQPVSNHTNKPAANHPQTTGRAATDHNPNNGHPAQRSAAPELKPATTAQQPKTRSADN